jgi:hypothetical protein
MKFAPILSKASGDDIRQIAEPPGRARSRAAGRAYV